MPSDSCFSKFLWAGRMSTSAPETHLPGAEQHADDSHVAHQQLLDKQEMAEQAHQEGFIGAADPSPAVLKTEFPAQLEPLLEQPAKTQQDTPDGEECCSRRCAVASFHIHNPCAC